MHRIGLPILLILVSCVFTGCGDSVSPETLAARKKFTLTSQPTGESSVSNIRKTLLEDAAPEEIDVVLRVRIHAGDMPPWEKGKAEFVVTDATGHEGEDDHDPHTCPFCSRHIDDYVANVKFRDGGNVIEIDSRELFEVHERQLIYIRGKATIDADDLLNINADGIYIVP